MCCDRHGGSDENVWREQHYVIIIQRGRKVYHEEENTRVSTDKIHGERRKIKENTNKIYGIVFGQCTPSLQPVLKGVTEYENKSKDCDFLWLLEEVNKITAGVDVKEKPRLHLIEQLISFVTMYQGTTETNYECLEIFNYWLQNLIVAEGKQILCILKTMNKSGETAKT